MKHSPSPRAAAASGWQLAIFDCDGVLVDSEPLAHQVLVEELRLFGIELDLSQAMSLFMGNSVEQNVVVIEGLLGRPLPKEFFPEWRERLYARFRSEPVRSVEGIVDVLEGLTVPACVVSNGPVRKMQTTLGVTGLLERFQSRLYSPESGLPGKPAPDLFLAAARDFGAAPARTFVVEDSPKGVAGAVSAGMRVFGYAGSGHVDAGELEAAGARVFTHMRELPGLIAAATPA
jgi:HAD superfamily hydrolase (TIGR01509 family)